MLVMLRPMFVMLLTPSQESSTKLKLPRSQDIAKLRKNDQEKLRKSSVNDQLKYHRKNNLKN